MTGLEIYTQVKSFSVLEQDTLLPESTGNPQERVALSRHD